MQRLLAEGNYEAAIPLMKDFVETCDRNAALVSSEEFADIVMQYAHLLQHAGRPEAMPAYQRLVLLREAIHGRRQHPAVAQALEDLANAFASNGMYPEAAHSFERAAAIWEATDPPNPEAHARCFEKLANLHLYFGRRSAALRVWDRVLVIRTAALGDSHAETQRTKREMDAIYEQIAALETEAERTFAAATAVRPPTGEVPRLAPRPEVPTI
eukprot:TRINITY_DN5371_c0_g1_i1.p2 TRINITY_DN5371_c0_g1~~TRINITY_DN5371_c0_g1_i1.p2  ORF type:complete len:213 (+),score=73.90 TRINITY_DN5371_c0_g1_i1:524-1162(+)